MSIRCEIVTRDKSLFEGDVDIVIVPGSDGEMGILPGHAPLLATLGYGILRVRVKGEEQAFTIAGGVIEARLAHREEPRAREESKGAREDHSLMSSSHAPTPLRSPVLGPCSRRIRARRERAGDRRPLRPASPSR